MEIFRAILEYVAIGVTVAVSVDLLAFMTKTPNPVSNPERIFIITMWPVTVLLFIRSIFKNFKR